MFQKLKFDENVCSDWHLYAVDYCLSVQKLGLKAYVLPMYVWHRSPGSLTEGYYTTLKKLLKKHRDQKWIYTTMGDWSPRIPFILQRRGYLMIGGLRIIEEEGFTIFLRRFLRFIFRKLK